jgi:hypothetical protein
MRDMVLLGCRYDNGFSVNDISYKPVLYVNGTAGSELA